MGPNPFQGWHLGLTEYFMELHQEMDFVNDAQVSPPPRKEPYSRLILGSAALVAVGVQAALVTPWAEALVVEALGDLIPAALLQPQSLVPCPY